MEEGGVGMVWWGAGIRVGVEARSRALSTAVCWAAVVVRARIAALVPWVSARVAACVALRAVELATVGGGGGARELRGWGGGRGVGSGLMGLENWTPRAIVLVVTVRVSEVGGRGDGEGLPMWRRRVLLRLRCWLVAEAKVVIAERKVAVSAVRMEGMRASVSSAYCVAVRRMGGGMGEGGMCSMGGRCRCQGRCASTSRSRLGQ